MNNHFNNWENWICTCKSTKLDPYLIPYTKINSKWVKVLNIRAKITKLLEENIGISLYDLKFGNSFFLFLSKNTSSNRKNNLDLKASLRAKLVEVIEFQLSHSKSWKTMLWKCCTQYASKFGNLSSGHRTGKGQFSFQFQRKAMPKNAQSTTQLHSSHTLVK